MITEISDEDRAMVLRYKEIADRRGICNPKQVTELFNRVTHRNERVVRCNGCLLGRIRTMYRELMEFDKEQERKKENENKKDIASS